MTPFHKRIILFVLIASAVVFGAITYFTQPQWWVKTQLRAKGVTFNRLESGELEAQLSSFRKTDFHENTLARLGEVEHVTSIRVVKPPVGTSLAFIDRMPKVTQLRLDLIPTFAIVSENLGPLLDSIADPTKLMSLTVADSMNKDEVQSIKRFSNLRKFQLCGFANQEIITGLSELTSLEEMSIELTQGEKNDYSPLARLPKLKKFTLGEKEYTGDALREFLSRPLSLKADS